MNKYYHFTSYNNLESIGKNGLVPQNGKRCKSIGDNKCAVFFSSGINNAIFLYAGILYYFNSHSGKNGELIIQNNKDKIKEYHENCRKLKKSKLIEIDFLLNEIENTKNTMQYASFEDYIEDGVYLTFKDIPNVIDTYPDDCYTNEIISAEEIKVITLVNKSTGQVIDNREAILNYFLSITPLYRFTRNICSIANLEAIKKLYIERQDCIMIYNPYNFEYHEVELNEYLKAREKSKVNIINSKSKIYKK